MSTESRVRRWIEQRVTEDLPMRQAAQGRDAAPGEVEGDEESDITTVLTRDHDQVVALMKQLKTIPGVTAGGSPVDLSRRKSIVDMVTVALSKHEATEQEEFWPAVRNLFTNGDQVAEIGLSQEQEGKDLLHRLGGLEPSAEEFDDLVLELDRATRKHVAHEDKVLLALRLTVAQDVRRELGTKFRQARRHAPRKPGGEAESQHGTEQIKETT